MARETILVIDNDKEAIRQIASILESEEYLVFTAPNADVGIEVAERVNPRLIFVNPIIEGSSGLELCTKIHSTENLNSVPIIVLSAFEGANDPRYTSLYGIVGSIKKPINDDELLKKTTSALTPQAASPAPVYSSTSASTAEIHENTKFSADKTDIIKPEKNKEELTDTVVLKPVNAEETKAKTDFKKIISESPYDTNVGYQRTYTLKTNIRRRSMVGKFIKFIFLIIVLVVIAGGGFILYNKGMLKGEKIEGFISSMTSLVMPSKDQPQKKPSLPVQQTAKTPQQNTPPIVPATTEPVKSLPGSITQATTQSVPQQTKPVTPIAPAATQPAPAAVQKIPVPAATTSPTFQQPAKTETKQTSTAPYHVQIGAFKNNDNADALTKKLKEKGYEAFTKQGTLKNKETIYRVLIGNFETQKEASKTAKKVSTKEKIKAVIYKD
ncbi:MAG: SPOR domain-containing protein [Nitrospiraceae bacterium]|nr:SPOR domain-containing protein [Nitrospiraceae bacterium]